MILKGVVGAGQAGMRLDDGAKALFADLSKGEIRKIIDWGGCSVAGVMVRVASRKLNPGDEICLGLLEPERRVDLTYSSEDLIFEDREYLAVNKQAGVNSQRTPYQLKGTVEFAVERYLKSCGVNEPARVIHRLDFGTSGVMFFPKSKRAATHISALLKRGDVEKRYWVLIAGMPEKEEWRVDASIGRISKFRYGVVKGGMEAHTTFRLLDSSRGATLVEARPLTGRTHQIRVHLAHCGLPVVGDGVYGGPPAGRMMLHCRFMGFTAADSGIITATAPVDDDFKRVCEEWWITLPD
jgi:RluA family pseudouridine synthase